MVPSDPICIKCKHFHNEQTCEAFPDLIPIAIWISEFDHHNPHPDDGGIQFERGIPIGLQKEKNG